MLMICVDIVSRCVFGRRPTRHSGPIAKSTT
jgi:hypothetical protein